MTIPTVMNVVCLFLPMDSRSTAVAAPRDEEQTRAIAFIEESGGKAVRDEEVLDKPVVSVTLVARAPESIQHLKGFARLRTLIARFGGIGDDDLKPLEGLSSLEVLNLESNEITDAG
jgi:hypothetical protein